MKYKLKHQGIETALLQKAEEYILENIKKYLCQFGVAAKSDLKQELFTENIMIQSICLIK